MTQGTTGYTLMVTQLTIQMQEFLKDSLFIVVIPVFSGGLNSLSAFSVMSHPYGLPKDCFVVSYSVTSLTRMRLVIGTANQVPVSISVTC